MYMVARFLSFVSVFLVITHHFYSARAMCRREGCLRGIAHYLHTHLQIVPLIGLFLYYVWQLYFDYQTGYFEMQAVEIAVFNFMLSGYFLLGVIPARRNRRYDDTRDTMIG